jgi:ABC-2 type transport system permease protein
MKRMRRLSSFLIKEILDIGRQPLMLLILILGPFLILFLFGIGYTGQQAPVRIIVVAPPDAQLPPSIEASLQDFGPSYPVVFTSDQQAAMKKLQNRAADLVAVVPPHTQDTILSGKQVTVHLYINAVSPFRRDYVSYTANTIVSDMNKELQRMVVEQASKAGNIDQVNPDILAQPIVTTSQNTARFKPTYVGFYAPAVLALLVQHIAVTFAALSLVRDRTQGTNELFNVSPLSPGEALAGKFLAYVLLTLAIGLILTILILYLLHIPLYGDPWYFLLLLALEISASLAWGFLISAVSRQDSQAVQLAMILLLSSVFFSGFFLDLDGLVRPLRVISYVMPVTYAIAGFQNVMLAGRLPLLWHIWALAGLTVVLSFLAWLFYRHQFRLS